MLRAFLGRLGKDPAKLLVVGNSSCDLDSVVSAICYSYFHSVYHDDRAGVAQPYVDIHPDELKLRKDIVFVLDKFGIGPGHLVFKDQLPKFKAPETGIVLVDHNNVQNADLQQFAVQAIIDHHADENKSPDASPRIITPCGSCTSLVFNYWYGRFEKTHRAALSDVFTPVAELVVSSILVDTSDMKFRVEQPDIDAIQQIRQFLPPSLDTASYFADIHEAKLDICGLSVRDLLSKDYKLLSAPNGAKVGFSSLAKPLSYILENNTESSHTFMEDVEAFGASHGLDAHVLMTSFVEPSDGKFKRELALHWKPGSSCAEIVPALTHQLQLVPKMKIADLQVYDQQDVASSRKQVLPLIKSLL